MPPKSWFLPRGPVLPSSNLSVAQVILAFCPSTARRRLLPTSLHGSTRVWPFIRSVSYRIVSIYGPLVRYVRRLAPGAAAANDETWPGYSLLPLRAGVPSHVYSRPAVPVRIHPCINHVTMAAELSSSSRSEFALGSTIRRTASNTTCIANQAFRQTDFFHEHGVSGAINYPPPPPSLASRHPVPLAWHHNSSNVRKRAQTAPCPPRPPPCRQRRLRFRENGSGEPPWSYTSCRDGVLGRRTSNPCRKRQPSAA